MGLDLRFLLDAFTIAGFAFMFTNLSGMFDIFAKVQKAFKDRGIDSCAFCLGFWMWLLLPIVRGYLGIGYAGTEYFEVFLPTIGVAYIFIGFLIYAKAQAIQADRSHEPYFEFAEYVEGTLEETQELTID